MPTDTFDHAISQLNRATNAVEQEMEDLFGVAQDLIKLLAKKEVKWSDEEKEALGNLAQAVDLEIELEDKDSDSDDEGDEA